MTQANAARNAALIAILEAAAVCNENGEQVVDFQERGRDCLDFCNVHINDLRDMLEAAYAAGRRSK